MVRFFWIVCGCLCLFLPPHTHTTTNTHTFLPFRLTQTHTTHTKGTLPGGVDPEALQKLTSSSEMMEIMANEKLQTLMRVRKRLHPPKPKPHVPTPTCTHPPQAVMNKDEEAMKEYMADAEVLQLMARFQELSQQAGIDPSMFGPPPGM